MASKKDISINEGDSGVGIIVCWFACYWLQLANEQTSKQSVRHILQMIRHLPLRH